MYYTALILRGYKRFALNPIATFILRPVEIIQLILGTNGSGKSSLLRELSPLPAVAADFQKDGSKEIHITDRGHQYRLISSFGSTTRHSFLRDGEELNPGGTATVHRELVQQTFGVTPETHELMLGTERFTTMGPARRREWFTKLSDINFDYAIAVYTRLKDEWRNVSGALKLDRRQLVLEQAKIITREEQAKLDAEVKSLHSDLTRLIELRAPIERPVEDIDVDRRAIENELRTMSRQLLGLRAQAPPALSGTLSGTQTGLPEKLTFENTGDVDRHIEAIRHRITAQEAVLTRCVTEHDQLREAVDVLRRRGSADLKSLSRRISQLQDARHQLLAARRLKLEGFEATAAMQTFTSISETLAEKLATLPAIGEGHYSAALLKQERERVLKLREARTQSMRQLASLQAKKLHAEQHRAQGSITCPKCRHVFTQGATGDTLRQLAKEIAAATDALARLEKQVTRAEESVATIQAYGDRYREIQQIIHMAPALKSFWEHLADTNELRLAPAKLVGTLALLGEDLELEVRAATHQLEIDEARKLLVQSERLGDATLEQSVQKLTGAARSVGELTQTLAAQRQSLADFTHYRRKLAEAMALASRIEAACREFETLTQEQVEMLYRSTIHQCIRQLQSELARKEEILSSLNQQKAVVASLEKIIDRRTLEEAALAAALQELSPTDGLIAEGLTGFIRVFTRQMNQLIRKIWVYPLEIRPCVAIEEKGVELDYRFPLMVGDEANVVADVSRGSSGMQEIVDLAFKVQAMKYLHLDEGPLLLDEWGITFDAAHRSASIAAVKQLMDTRPFSQLFMISHYAATYGAFSNVQTCVLDARNIAVPKVYNTHVTMT
ncbi:hypothetical protein [Paraburkholderia adhaesiva]|uniref:hypothetical protein n=1 Tax=Paraburkholderia adhaesiva TaxID=2883244 RepID=UPI001F2D81BD|nr:hypothetical protein [Paraburkholderia adhaesiva]